MARSEICVNVTTVIKYLLPGGTTTDTGEAGSEIPRSTLLLSVLIALSRLVAATFAIALRSARAAGGWPSWTDGLFMGGWDNFSRKVQPDGID